MPDHHDSLPHADVLRDPILPQGQQPLDHVGQTVCVVRQRGGGVGWEIQLGQVRG